MLLLIPGPVTTRPEVRQAMAQDIAPWDDDFRAVYARIRERVLRIAHGVPSTHATLPLQQAGGHFLPWKPHCAPSRRKAAAFSSPPPARTLTAWSAWPGKPAAWRWCPLPVPDDTPALPAAIATALAADPTISHVGLVYSETSSGVIHDAPAIGAAVRQAGRRMILDAVSAFGALPLDLSAQPEIDAAVFTTNKCLEGLPGMSFAVARIDRALACAGNAGSWALDLSDIYAHALKSGWGTFRFTPAAQTIAAFDLALDFYDAEGGQPARLARYAENASTLAIKA